MSCKKRHDVDNGDYDDDEEEEDGVITLNHGIVWISSRLRILWSISLQNLVIVIIIASIFSEGRIQKVLVVFISLVEFPSIYCILQSRLDDSYFDNLAIGIESFLWQALRLAPSSSSIIIIAKLTWEWFLWRALRWEPQGGTPRSPSSS